MEDGGRREEGEIIWGGSLAVCGVFATFTQGKEEAGGSPENGGCRGVGVSGLCPVLCRRGVCRYVRQGRHGERE